MDRGEPQPSDNQPQEPERTSGIMRVPAFSPEDESALLGSIKRDLFDGHREWPGEREKTPSEMEIINAILVSLPEFIKEYGGKPLALRADHLHVIDYDNLTEDEKKRRSSPGFFMSKNQEALVVCKSENYSAIKFAEVVVHELIHFSSFQSVDYSAESRKISERTLGFAMTVTNGKNPDDKPELYFHGVNEAITAELTKRFSEKYLGSIPVLAEDINRRNEFRAEIKKGDATEIMVFSNTKKPDGTWRAISEDYPYADERENCWAMMQEIQEKNPDKFRDAEGVFRGFVNAYFTGRFMPVVRLLEKTYGKGFFRRLGKNTKAE